MAFGYSAVFTKRHCGRAIKRLARRYQARTRARHDIDSHAALFLAKSHLRKSQNFILDLRQRAARKVAKIKLAVVGEDLLFTNKPLLVADVYHGVGPAVLCARIYAQAKRKRQNR